MNKSLKGFWISLFLASWFAFMVWINCISDFKYAKALAFVNGGFIVINIIFCINHLIYYRKTK